jgi:hypothetical protein
VVGAIVDLELTRVPGDRRLFTLAGVGTLRLRGIASRTAVATAAGATWDLARPRFWSQDVNATDEAGTIVGSFRPRALRRGGTVVWADRELVLRPASAWRERYAVAAGETEFAIFEGKGWGARPVRIQVGDSAIEPGLLLFTAFVVRGLAEDASGAAGAAAGAAVTG